VTGTPAEREADRKIRKTTLGTVLGRGGGRAGRLEGRGLTRLLGGSRSGQRKHKRTEPNELTRARGERTDDEGVAADNLNYKVHKAKKLELQT